MVYIRFVYLFIYLPLFFQLGHDNHTPATNIRWICSWLEWVERGGWNLWFNFGFILVSVVVYCLYLWLLYTNLAIREKVVPLIPPYFWIKFFVCGASLDALEAHKKTAFRFRSWINVCTVIIFSRFLMSWKSDVWLLIKF